jgi:hypothetical protein
MQALNFETITEKKLRRYYLEIAEVLAAGREHAEIFIYV